MKKLLKSILIATAGIGMVAGTTAAVVSCGESGTTVSPEQKNYNDEIQKMSDYLVAHPVHFDINDDGLVDLTKAINDYLTQAPTTDKQYLTATVTSDMIKDAGNIDLTKSHSGAVTIIVDISASDAYKTKVVTDGQKLTLDFTVTLTDASTYNSAIDKIHAHFDVNNLPFFWVHQEAAGLDATGFSKSLIGDYIKDRINSYVNSTWTGATGFLTQAEKNSLAIGDDWSGITVTYTGSATLDTSNPNPTDTTDTLSPTQTITIAIKGMPGSGAETTGTPKVYSAAQYIISSNNLATQYAAEADSVIAQFSKEVTAQEFPIAFAGLGIPAAKTAIITAINEYIKKHSTDSNTSTSTKLLKPVVEEDFTGWESLPIAGVPGEITATNFQIIIKPIDTIRVAPTSAKAFALKYWLDTPDGQEQNFTKAMSQIWTTASPLKLNLHIGKSVQENYVTKTIANKINELRNSKGNPYSSMFKDGAAGEVTASNLTLTNYFHVYVGEKTYNLRITLASTVLNTGIRSFYSFSISVKGAV